MVEKEIDTVCSQYGLKPTSLSELALEINYPDFVKYEEDGFGELDNAVYLPFSESFHVTDSLLSFLEESLDPHGFIQLGLDPEKASAAYLVDFLNSPLGRKIRKAWEKRSFIWKQAWPASGDSEGADFGGDGGNCAATIFVPTVDTNAITHSMIYLPDRQTQEEILKLKALIDELVYQLNIFEHRLSAYPKDIAHIKEKIELIREAIQLANDSDYLLEIIRRGESKKLEFKSTLRLNLMTGKPDKEIEHAVLKTIVAYLNTDGGVLLVGVSNDGEVLGIETDGFPNEDKFLLHFKQLIKQRIGLAYSPLIEYSLVPVNGRKVLEIDCRKSDEAVFLKSSNNDEEFFIRIGPSSERLTGSKLIEYVNRWYNGISS
ncbi:MAG: ATP-binding protein [Methanosarcinaceae archaeon]|nr:ATP-binding protein [Methanosarcinaceae archaeon]